MCSMNLIERFKRWWAPAEYDDEQPSEGSGFARSDEDYAHREPTTPIVHPRERILGDPDDV
jgi:hypothetical protein